MAEIPEILKLAGLDIEVPDVAQKLAKLVQDGTTFAQVNVAPAELIQPLSLQGEDTVQLDGARFTLGGSFNAQLAIAVFNEPTDTDEDQILQPTAGGAWLKHKLEAGIKGSIGGKLGDNLDFGLQGQAGASLLQYRAHKPGEPVGLAVAADIASFRLPIRLDDVRKLQKGDILACTVHGKLALHAKLTWADALSAALSSLDERLGAAGVSAIKLDLGASIGVNLAIEDDYRLIFQSGSQKATIRIDVRKTKGRTVGVSAGFSVEASVADPAALSGALAAYAMARLAQPWERVQALIERIDAAVALQDLNPDERSLAEQIGTRLGLSNLQQEWQELKTRLNNLPADLAARLEEALKTKIKVELQLEYSRISTEQIVLACEIKADRLKEHHGDLLRGNLTKLLDRLAAQEAGYQLIEYLKTTKVTRQLSFGLSIGIGQWAASGVDQVFREWERQADLNDQHERRSFTGRRTYQAIWGGETFQYAFGLAAAMDRFSSSRTANASEFDYSLSFGWSWKDRLTPALLAEALDLANLWKILGQREIQANLDAVLTEASGPATIEVEVKISDTGVRSLLAVPRNQFEEAWIEAMAAALPRVKLASMVFRSRLGDRVKVYGRAARVAFEQSTAGVEIAAIAGRIDYNPDEEVNTLVQLRRIDRGEILTGGFPDLSLEKLWLSSSGNTRPAGRCHRAKDALDGLAQAISGNLKPEEIERTFNDIQDLMTRPYECRLLGRVMASLVAARRPAEIIKTLRVTAEDGTAILI
jgi:hypothetical protein